MGKGQKGQQVPREERQVRILPNPNSDYRENEKRRREHDERERVLLAERVNEDRRRRERSRAMEETEEYRRWHQKAEGYRLWHGNAWVAPERNTRSRHAYEEDRAIEFQADNRSYSRRDQSNAGSRGHSTWSPSLPPPANVRGGERLRTRSPRERRPFSRGPERQGVEIVRWAPGYSDRPTQREQMDWTGSDWERFDARHRPGRGR